MELNFLEPIYLEPKTDEYGIDGDILPEQVEEALKENTDIKLVVITSPTYEGIISNIKKITKIAHTYGIPVLVDEAHGAHLKFVEKLKEYEALNAGADIVVQSLHKTLPALTQCAIMHIQGNLISEEEVERALDIFETSSPSYILMSSIDECLTVIEEKGIDLFKQYDENLKEFYKRADELKKLKVLKNCIRQIKYDNGKIVIITEDTNINGKQLADILRIQYHIEIEMANVNYIIAMTSICDAHKNFERLVEALLEIDKIIEYKNENKTVHAVNMPKRKLLVNETQSFKESKLINYKEAIGKISKEYIWIYPPGIPIVVPGEVISQSMIEKLDSIIQADIDIKTSFNQFPNIECV